VIANSSRPCSVVILNLSTLVVRCAPSRWVFAGRLWPAMVDVVSRAAIDRPGYATPTTASTGLMAARHLYRIVICYAQPITTKYTDRVGMSPFAAVGSNSDPPPLWIQTADISPTRSGAEPDFADRLQVIISEIAVILRLGGRGGFAVTAFRRPDAPAGRDGDRELGSNPPGRGDDLGGE
jgi:hypothetical protein